MEVEEGAKGLLRTTSQAGRTAEQWPLEMRPQPAVTQQRAVRGWGVEPEQRRDTAARGHTHATPTAARAAEAGQAGGREPHLEDMETGRHRARSPGSGGDKAEGSERPTPSFSHVQRHCTLLRGCVWMDTDTGA